jgi:hypothetical protein
MLQNLESIKKSLESGLLQGNFNNRSDNPDMEIELFGSDEKPGSVQLCTWLTREKL